MEKVIWRTTRLTIPAGDTFQEKEISLEKGKRIVAAIATSKEPGQLVNMGLFENGQGISEPVDLDFWRRSNSGRYLDGFKPIEYTGGSTLAVRIASAQGLAEDLQVEVVFGIIQDATTC